MASTAPASKADRPVFTSGSTDYTVRDVIDAAHFRGEVQAAWQQSLVRGEAAARGQESEAELDQEALDSAAVAFRYHYDLITAEETEAWLEARGLTLAEFSEYLARLEWEKEFGGRVEPPLTAFVEATPEQRDRLVIDLVLSGEFDSMARRLAWRVAVQAAAQEKGEGAQDNTEEWTRFLRRAGLAASGLGGWLRALGRDESWLDQMLAMELAYRARCEERLTPEARERELAAVRLPLTSFAVEMVELESRDAAREAFMCVRDDGMSMAEVAREGRYPFHQTEMLLEQISDDLQQKFLSLMPGSLLEPTPREDGFLLTRILEKKDPKLDDPEVRQRVERRILERHFSDISSGRIQWRIAMNGT